MTGIVYDICTIGYRQLNLLYNSSSILRGYKIERGKLIIPSQIENPTIFSQVIALLNDQEPTPFDTAKHFETMIRYLEASVKYIGEKHACKMMRSRLCWFAKGLPNSSRFRESIKRVSTEQEAKKLILEYRASLI